MLSIYLDAQLDKLRGHFNVDSENEDYVMRGPVRQVRRDVLQFRMRSDRQGQKRMNRIRPIWCPSGAYLTVLFPSPYDTVPTYDSECIFYNAIHCIRDRDKGCLHDVAIDAGAKNACILIKIKLNVGSPVRI